MRNYIKTLAMLLMVSLGFAACNDNDDFDDYKVNYPTTIPQGYYQSTFTFEGDYEYGVVLTTDEENNTVLQLISEGKAEGNDSAMVRTLIATKNLAYADSIGTLLAVDTIGDNFYEEPMQVYMAYKMNCTEIVLSVTHGDKSFSSVLLPTKEQPNVASRWTSGNFILDIKSVGENAEALPGYIILDSSNESAEPEAITYNYDGKNGSFTTANGAKGTFSYNEKYQLAVTFNNTTYTCNRSYSVPEPETFNQIAIGTYSHSVGVIEGGPVFDAVYEAGLYQSDKNPNNYVIAPWLDNPNGLFVMVDPETGKVTVPQQFTGVTDPKYGDIYAVDVLTYTGGQIPSDSKFDGKVFHLDLGYVVSAGYFGFVNETFEITEMAESNAKAPFAAAQKSTSKFNVKNNLIKNF